MKLIDRERERDGLLELANRRRPAMALLYGRRRVGKTFLLSHVFRERRHFYFLAAETTPEANRADLLRELSVFLGRSLPPEDYPNWRTVFRLLPGIAGDGLVVVLDEFQHLLAGDEGLASQLIAVWDREIEERPLTLILCGSELSVMEGLAGAASPLYGRITWRGHLRPFDFRDSQRMVPWLPLRDRFVAFGVFGGTPRFLAALREGENLGEAIVRTLLSPSGEVHLQLETLIEQERGIRSVAEHRAVLSAVAAGYTGVAEIAEAAGFAGRRHAAVHVLDTLEKLEIVFRERNFDARRTTPWRFRLADPAVRSWHRFVLPERARLERGEAGRVFAERVRPALDTYVFERIVHNALARLLERWDLPGALETARFEGQDRNRRSIEIDLLARTADGRILAGETKWSSSPVGPSLHSGLLRNLMDLAASGHGFAREALDPATSAGTLFVSAAGFTRDFRALARKRGDIRLLSLEDLRAG
jgi:AAA+ ATPase superfamily predicted ATPase